MDRSRVLVGLSMLIVLGASGVVTAVHAEETAPAAPEMNNANRAIEAAKAKTKASGSPYGEMSSPNTRQTYPSVMTLEILGRGMLWSVGFDQALSGDMSAGFGIGSVGTTIRGSSTSASQQAWIVPVYFNYYFMPHANSIYATGGVNLVTNNNKVKALDAETSGVEFGSSSVAPTFGLGWESRGDNGFLFRLAGYGILSNSKVAPWVGFTFGFAF